MDKGDAKLKAFEFFKELATQLITLSVGTVVFSGTFYKDIIAGAPAHQRLLEGSWFLFFLSVICGISVLGALSFELNDVGPPEQLDIYRSTIRWTVSGELATFIVAVFLFGAFIALNLSSATNHTV